MLFVSSIVLTLVMLALGGFGPLMQYEALYGSSLSVLHGIVTASALLLFFHAMAIGQISVVAPIVATHPVIIILFHAAHGAAFTLVQIASIAVILIGVGLVGGAAPNQLPQAESGKQYAPVSKVVLLSVTASVVYGVAIILLQEASGQIGDLQVLWFGRVAGFLTVAVFVLFAGSAAHRMSWIWVLVFLVHGTLDSGGLLFLIFGSTGGAGSALAAVAASTFPVVTVGLATFILKERMSGLQILGAVLVFVGVALLVGTSEG